LVQMSKDNHFFQSLTTKYQTDARPKNPIMARFS